MKVSAFLPLLALILGGCLPPPGERKIPPEYIEQRVMPIGAWDVGCNNLGQCVAIGAIPPRKKVMDAMRAALRINLDNLNGPNRGLTIIPLDFEQRLPDVTPTPEQADQIWAKLREGQDFLIWVTDKGDGSRYYVPGQGFAKVELVHQQWIKKFPTRWVESEAIVPAKAIPLTNFRAPVLTAAQLVDCKADDKGRADAAWDVAGAFLLFRYSCSAAKGSFSETLWFTQEKRNGRFSAVGFAEAVGPLTDGKAAGLSEAYFNEEQGLMVARTAVDLLRGCGLSATYAATPSGFVLADRREARNCHGLFSGDWVNIYRSPAVIMPEHW